MIRTRLVELSTIEAIAYRRKLRGGHSGVVIQRFDSAQPGLASINRNDGSPDIAHNVPKDLFPVEAFVEALDLTSGLPYNQRGTIKLGAAPEKPEEVEETEAEIATVCSKEYGAIVAAYTDKRGALSYDLLNKDFIQFAKSSKVVADMAAAKAPVEEIRNHVVKVKLEQLTGNRNLTDAQTAAIVEMLDEVSPRNVFKVLNDELRKMLAR
ncbi:MAG: hypothetical protein ACK4GW_02400 [Pseudorhodobacter sp.]